MIYDNYFKPNLGPNAAPNLIILLRIHLLTVIPGVTLRQCFAKGWEEGFEGNLQIGRTPPLSSDKAGAYLAIYSPRSILICTVYTFHTHSSITCTLLYSQYIIQSPIFRYYNGKPTFPTTKCYFLMIATGGTIVQMWNEIVLGL